MTAVQISALCFALSVLPTAQQSTPPQVELDRAPVSSGRALDWKGKRLNEIVPPASVKRIVRTNSDNFGGAFDISQATFNALFAKLFSSPERADDCAVASKEWMLAEFRFWRAATNCFRPTLRGIECRSPLCFCAAAATVARVSR
jgi:hypothetical protein